MSHEHASAESSTPLDDIELELSVDTCLLSDIPLVTQFLSTLFSSQCRLSIVWGAIFKVLVCIFLAQSLSLGCLPASWWVAKMWPPCAVRARLAGWCKQCTPQCSIHCNQLLHSVCTWTVSQSAWLDSTSLHCSALCSTLVSSPVLGHKGKSTPGLGLLEKLLDTIAKVISSMDDFASGCASDW